VNILAGSIRRAILLWAVPIALTLFAVPQVARADVFCGSTVFGQLCANGVITQGTSFAQFGNPQPLASVGALTCVGKCGGFLDSVSLSLLGGGGVQRFRYDRGIRVFPKRLCGRIRGQPGGALALFNSIGTLNGVFGVPFADLLIVGDPSTLYI
jgi:hypothetical protein